MAEAAAAESLGSYITPGTIVITAGAAAYMELPNVGLM